MRKRIKKVSSKTSLKDKKVSVEVISFIAHTYENYLGRSIARAIDKGYELMSPPVFSYTGEPQGWNGAVVGYNHPHFLVLMIKRPPKTTTMGLG